MNSRERFLAAVACKPVDRTPLWVMRQAGRYLPEYRELKARSSFLEMVRTPELATEVTLQPLRRFPLDAAILFSDILVIPEALGQPYHFRDTGGIAMEFRLETPAQIAALQPEAVREKLSYVAGALRLIRGELAGEKALLGFCGSPWTLATYMLEGGSSEDFSRAKTLRREQPKLFERLMEILCAALIDYIKMQIEAGVDAVQIFDSWGGALAADEYEEGSLRWIRQIVATLPKDFPVIVYAKGCAQHSQKIAATGARVLGIDWTVDLAEVRRSLPSGVAVQGNLDPELMTGAPEGVRSATNKLLENMRGLNGHILNLGHGITPEAKIECMEALCETAQTFS